MSLPPGAREAAERYAREEGGYDCNPRYERNAFLAGTEWALSPPTPEEIEAAREAYKTAPPFSGIAQCVPYRMRAAILAFLEERKRP